MDRGQADAGHHRLKHWLGGAAVLAAFAPAAALAEDRPAEQKGVLSFLVENDSLSSGGDRNYTSGVKLAYVSPSEGVPDWLRGAGGFTRTFSGSNPDFWGIAIGQSIFTPEDINAVPAPPDQHPYAGWLYMQIMVGAEEDRSDGRPPRYLDTYELEFGIVGPAALGEESQRGIHAVLGAPDPQGWDSQLNNEFAFAASFDRRWRPSWARFSTDVAGLEFDLTPNAGVTLGTLRTEARAGLTFTLGQYLPREGFFGPPRVRPSLSGVEHFESVPFSWQVFVGVQGRGVARNLFLDGNTFVDSASVDRNAWVGDLQAGVAVTFRDFRVAYTYVTRTEEFASQPTTQDFGALAVSFRL
jgi:hypothetical protein